MMRTTIRRSLWLLIVLTLPTTSEAIARQQAGSGAGVATHQSEWRTDAGIGKPSVAPPRRDAFGLYRIGHISYEIGLQAAQGKRDHDGHSVLSATMGTLMVAMQFSLLHLMRPGESRLRITDYLRFDAAMGGFKEEESELAPGRRPDVLGGGVIGYFTYGVGVQASYLLTDRLEVGGVVAKGTWNDEMAFGYGNSLRDTGTPLIWIGRLRYGILHSELHLGATPRSSWHSSHMYNKADQFDHRDIYRSYRLRVSPEGRMIFIGLELDQYDFRVYRPEPSVLSRWMTDRSAKALRIVMGAMH